METKFIRPLIALGIPGVALGIFYLLLKKFDFQFSQVDSTWTVVIVLVFLFMISGITFYALHRWAPTHQKSAELPPIDKKPFEFKMGEEVVRYEEKLTSLPFDVVKIHAHSHFVGVAAEYAWLEHKYPESERIMQSITTLDLLKKSGKYKAGQVHFDIIKFRLPDGREKELYFDISSFFDGATSSLLSPDEFVSKKLSELYQ